ncbi:hypothetical protein NPIL_343621 [Nephila pilipes]|uniref:Uncharacterized protein n=1 Tax=Nephila pilipes TaxID=299642 RepID=A0A8X6NQZ6_NEPPI|nr:hypothetical protein NPIL_343621 [Nephila pilipes]
MASTSVHEERNDKVINIDTSVLNQLMYSIGRLKFSLRNLETLNLQLSLFPSEEEETKVSVECSEDTESNKILENIIHDIVSERSCSKQKKVQNDGKLCKDSPQNISDLADLELIHERLLSELQNIRQSYQKAFSKKTKNSLT